MSTEREPLENEVETGGKTEQKQEAENRVPKDGGEEKKAKVKDEPKKADKQAGVKQKELGAQLEAAGEEILELKDQLLRKQADFDNFRKRMFREKEEAIAYANSLLLQDMITVIDDFERAIKSSEESKDFEALHSGVVLIEKQLSGLLERKYGLKRFESQGEEFDPDKHEALAFEELPDYTKKVVSEDYLKGYTLNDRVLRHAKVKVVGPVTEKKEE